MWDEFVFATAIPALTVSVIVCAPLLYLRRRARGRDCLICKRNWREAGPFVQIRKGYCLCGDCIDASRQMLDAELRRLGKLPPLPVNEPGQSADSPSG